MGWLLLILSQFSPMRSCKKDCCIVDEVETRTTPIWLTMRERIKFKILLYVYKSIHGEAPSYLSEHLNLYNTGRPEGGRRLRSSSDVTRLVVPRSTRKVGDNSYIVVAPKLWNQLPCEIREAASTPVFKRLLKTFLFPDWGHPNTLGSHSLQLHLFFLYANWLIY